MDGYVHISLSLKHTSSTCGYGNLALPTVGPQFWGGHAEWQPGRAWRGQLSHGSDAEEILEDQTGPHQSHGQEGGWVCGGLWCWPGRQARGGRRYARQLSVICSSCRGISCPIPPFKLAHGTNDVGDFYSDSIQNVWLFCIYLHHLLAALKQQVGWCKRHRFGWGLGIVLFLRKNAEWHVSMWWYDAAITDKKTWFVYFRSCKHHLALK